MMVFHCDWKASLRTSLARCQYQMYVASNDPFEARVGKYSECYTLRDFHHLTSRVESNSTKLRNNSCMGVFLESFNRPTAIEAHLQTFTG